MLISKIPPTLSVIIPTFNRADFVRDCLIALRESGVPDLEVIVVDDGSTDDTASVVREYAPQAVYLTQSNQGPAAARNRGFEQSRGRYVGFLDCDDEWLPGEPAEAIRWLDGHPGVGVLFADALMGNRQDGFQSWIEAAGQETFFDLPHCEAGDGYRILDKDAFLKRMLFRNAVFLGAAILRRDAFERIGKFDTALCGAADWNLWLRLAAQNVFAYRHAPLAIYTKHPEGMSNDKDGMSREFCMALHKLSHQVTLSVDAETVRSRQLRHHLFSYAYRAFNRGDYVEAKRRFHDVLNGSGWDLRSFIYKTACSLPFGMAGLLRKTKHLVAGRQPIPVVVESTPASKAVLVERGRVSAP